jgi:Mce-associated membrane protein
MPPRKRTSPGLNGDADIDAGNAAAVDPADALALAEEAEAEAAEAEALANAARARARALKLRRQAEAAAADARLDSASAAPAVAEPAVVAETEADEIDQPIAASDQSADRVHETADESDTAGAELDEGPEYDVVDGPEDADGEPARRRRFKLPRIRVKVLAAGLVILCSLGLLGVSGYMIWQHRRVAAEQQRAAEFGAAAQQGVVTMMSLDFNHADEDVKRIVDNATGDFKKDFQNATQDFTKVAQDSKVITTATVNAAAVQSMARDTATVLVSATTHVSNAASKDQPPRTWRLFVDIARDGGQLKLAKVEFVP